MKWDLEEILGKVWQAKWKILLFQLAIVALCISVILYWPRSYRSEARLFLQLGREAVSLDPTAATGQLISVQQSDREDEIATALDVIKGRGLIAKVVEQLSPEIVLGKMSYGEAKESAVANKVKEWIGAAIDSIKRIDPMSDFERAVMNIEDNMKVRAERKSEVIVIEFESETPQLAKLVVGTLVKSYQEEYARLHRTEGSQSFFDGQQSLLQDELDNATESLRRAKNRMGVASIKGERDALESRFREVSQSLLETEQNFDEIRGRISRIGTQLKETPERVASLMVDKANYATDLQSQQLYALQLNELELRSKYSSEHPKMIALKSQVKEAEDKLKTQSNRRPESTDDINPIHRELSLDMAKAESIRSGYEKKLATLASQKEELVEEIQTLNGHEVEILNLEREIQIREKKYLTYTESLEQARISKALEANKITSVSIAQEATLQERPVSPSKLLIVVFGGMAAIAGSGLLGLISVTLDDRLITPNAVKNRLGIPVLGTLPKSRSLAKLHV